MSVDRPRPTCYGVTIETELPLANTLNADKAVAVPLRDGPLEQSLVDRGDLLQASAGRADDGTHFASLHRVGGSIVFRVRAVADYRLFEDRIEINVIDDDRFDLIELHLLGPVLSMWLERRGVVALHESAVVAPCGGLGFLGHQGAGKSTPAATLVSAGAALLSDDVLALDLAGDGVSCRPGLPVMRMWPEQASAFIDGTPALERVHSGRDKRRIPVGPGGFGAFCDRVTPPQTLYPPSRTDAVSTGVSVERLSGSDALVEMLRHSFVGMLAETIIGPARLRRVAAVARHIEVVRLRYPRGRSALNWSSTASGSVGV